MHDDHPHIPETHPDLAAVAESMRSRFGALLHHEREAAALQARRVATIRDVLLGADDSDSPVAIWSTLGHRYEGRIDAVGLDHVAVGGRRRVVIPLEHIAAVEL